MSQLQPDTATQRTIASLNMSLAALKSLLSDYVVRAKSAEDASAVLMQDKLGPELLKDLAALIENQLGVRASERAVHQQAILQTTVVALNDALSHEQDKLRAEVELVIKELTRSLSTMNG